MRQLSVGLDADFHGLTVADFARCVGDFNFDAEGPRGRIGRPRQESDLSEIFSTGCQPRARA